jgi:hypothetical protein
MRQWCDSFRIGGMKIAGVGDLHSGSGSRSRLLTG